MRITGLDNTISELTKIKETIQKDIEVKTREKSEMKAKQEELTISIAGIEKEIEDKAATLEKVKESISNLSVLSVGVNNTTTTILKQEKVPDYLNPYYNSCLDNNLKDLNKEDTSSVSSVKEE